MKPTTRFGSITFWQFLEITFSPGFSSRPISERGDLHEFFWIADSRDFQLSYTHANAESLLVGEIVSDLVLTTMKPIA